MAMAGILIIVTDVVDDSLIWNRGPTYYQPVLVITGLLLALPIVLSPFISLYAQISRKSAADSIVTLREWFSKCTKCRYCNHCSHNPSSLFWFN